jgi:hypothetical protein
MHPVLNCPYKVLYSLNKNTTQTYFTCVEHECIHGRWFIPNVPVVEYLEVCKYADPATVYPNKTFYAMDVFLNKVKGPYERPRFW